MARHSHPFALVQTSWCELGPTTVQLGAADSWPNTFSPEKSRLHVLIRFSTPELTAQHMSKHQHFCLHLALILLSPPLCTKCCWQKSASSKRKPFLIPEDGEKRDKDRKRDVHRRGGCPHSSSPVKSPHRKFIPAPSPSPSPSPAPSPSP